MPAKARAHSQRPSGTSEQAAKKVLLVDSLSSAAKAGTESKPVIAAINRCATQNQCTTEFFRDPYGLTGITLGGP
jgi:hypothetical protein